MKNNLLSVSILLATLIITSCSKDTNINDRNLGMEIKARSSLLAVISYEIDYLITTKFNCNPTFHDISSSEPISDKQSVTMSLFENGEVELITEQLTSRNNLSISHPSPPNDQPIISKTVLANNLLKLYDSNDQLIRSIPTQSISLSYSADQIENLLAQSTASSGNIGNIISCVRANANFATLLSWINSPPTGVVINQISNDVYTIRMPIPQELASNGAVEAVHIVDISDKLLLASSLYDNNSKCMECIIFRYDNCEFIGFKQEVRDKLPDCADVKTQLFADISNISIDFN